MPNGQAMPVAHAMAAGIPTLNAAKAKVAPCQLFPKWETTMIDAYCWQHKNAVPNEDELRRERARDNND